MPKQVFSNDVLTIEVDPNDAVEVAKKTIHGRKGDSIEKLTQKEMTALLQALNTLYNLGLTD